MSLIRCQGLSPSIGPYHHHQPHLKQAEKVKHMAVISCVIESGHLAEEVYLEVAHVADNHARRLYDKDVMAGISCADFRDMMFVDACFLVQYMRMDCGIAIDESLVGSCAQTAATSAMISFCSRTSFPGRWWRRS
jgi:hypothetical protein